MSNMKIIIVTGSRDHTDFEFIKKSLDSIVPKPDLLVHGNCNGADAIADKWATDNNIHPARIPALWKTRGPKGGPQRNKLMLEAFPSAEVVAFPLPGSKGTANCMRLAKLMNMKVTVFTKLKYYEHDT